MTQKCVETMTVMKTSASTVVNSTQASSPRGVGEKGREWGELFPSLHPLGPLARMLNSNTPTGTWSSPEYVQ